MRIGLGGLEFEGLWFMTGRDRMPYPLTYAYPAGVRTVAEVDQLRREATAGLVAKYDAALALGMGALHDPDVRVEVRGFKGAGLGTDIRVLAAVRGADGVVVAQTPDAGPGRSGDFTMTVCEAADVPRVIVGELPDAPAGTLDDLNFRRAQLFEEPDDQAGWDRPATPAERVARMFRREPTSWGEITAYRGAAVDNRPTNDGRGFFWMHFADDGGYFVRNDAVVQARPMSTEMTVASLNGLIKTT